MCANHNPKVELDRKKSEWMNLISSRRMTKEMNNSSGTSEQTKERERTVRTTDLFIYLYNI